jgi:hypothetical protein
MITIKSNSADGPDENSSAHYDVEANNLAIRDLVIHDPVVVGEARHWSTGSRGATTSDDILAAADMRPYVEAALTAGAIAIRGAGGTLEAHHLDRLVAEVGDRSAAAATTAGEHTAAVVTEATAAMTRTSEQAQRAIAEAGQSVRQVFTTQVEEATTKLTGELGRLLGGDTPVIRAQLDAVMGAFAHDLDHKTGSRTDELFRTAVKQLDPRDPTSPFAEFSKRITDQQQTATAQILAENKRLGEQVDKLTIAVHAATSSSSATAAAAKVTPLKGTSYADGVHHVLDHLAGGFGDAYLDTSSEVGNISRCRKGDGVLVLTCEQHINARVVIEMTDADTARRHWGEYLEEAERNRNAAASLGLVRTVEQMPAGDLVRTFGPRRIVMAFDPQTDDPALLRAVLLLLRGQAQLAVARTSGDHLDTAREKLAEALSCIQCLTEVQKTAGAIRKGADKIDTDCAVMSSTLRRVLAEAQAALTGGDAASAAA